MSRCMIAWILFGLGTAALVFAANEGPYRAVTGWPAGRDAPDYGMHAVSAVATDAKGRVYVFQRAPHPVLVFDRDGRYLTTWGAGQFTNPHGCRVDSAGSVWLTDSADHRVLKFSPEGRLLASFGVKNEPGEDASHFNRPTDVAFAPKGDVFVSDGYGNSRVVRLSREGKYLGAWGRKGNGEGEFNLPHSIAVDARGRVYVADRENERIQLFTPEGKFIAQWRQVGKPFGLFINREQRLFVADGRANTLAVFDLEGKRLAQWGETGKAPGQMDLAHLLCVDDQGAVYVAEVNGKRVQKFVPDRT